MKLPKELTTVTPLSKILALLMFILMPIFGFFLWMQYQKTIPQEKSVEGKPCGGFAGETGEFACPNGYTCQYPKPMYPDGSGTCVKN